MSDRTFEQRVIEALVPLLNGCDEPEIDARIVAPRVVAAIEAAAQTRLRKVTSDAVVRERKDAALAALRGEHD